MNVLTDHPGFTVPDPAEDQSNLLVQVHPVSTMALQVGRMPKDAAAKVKRNL